MTRTFIDSGVLIAAARGDGIIAQRALAILQDPNREFASSIFLKLEVLPKAIYNNRTSEVRFYEEYFDAVLYWATSSSFGIPRFPLPASCTVNPLLSLSGYN